MFIKYTHNKIKASRKEKPFKKLKGYDYLEVPDNTIIDEFSYIENGKLKRKPQSEIDAILLERENKRKERELYNQKQRILSYKGNKDDLLDNGTWEEILAYREIKTQIKDSKTDLALLEKNILIEKIGTKDFDLQNKTLSELQAINNQFI